MKLIPTDTPLPRTLLKFRTPIDLRSDFQEACWRQYVIMTAMLNLRALGFLKVQASGSIVRNPKSKKQSNRDTKDARREPFHG